MTRRNLNVMGNVFANNTFKFAANVMMAMLFITLISACSKETANFHPTAASSLIGSMTEANGLGWATVDVEANAKDINGDPISAAADVRYTCEKEVFVENEEELGLPVVLSLAGDNLIATGDGNVITRTENHSASKGVVLNVAGPDLSKGGYLGERITSGDTIRQEVMANLSDEAFATAPLPESFQKEWRGSKISVVKYYRVYVKKAAEPIVYRKSLTLNLENAAKGKAYGNMLVEKVQGTTVLDSWDCFGIMAKWGKYNPQVTAQSVTSFDFTSHDLLGETKDLEADLPNLGKDKTFTRKNVRHTAETFEVRFQSNPDADGNTVRPIRGQIDVWVYEYVFVNPEDNHTETFTVEVEVKSVKSEVNNSTYEREIHVVINGQTVDVQNGKVQLTIG